MYLKRATISTILLISICHPLCARDFAKWLPPTLQRITIHFFVAETISFRNISPLGLLPHANFQCLINFMTWSPSAIPLNSS